MTYEDAKKQWEESGLYAHGDDGFEFFFNAGLRERMSVEQSCNRCGEYHGKEPCSDVPAMQAVVDAAKRAKTLIDHKIHGEGEISLVDIFDILYVPLKALNKEE